MEGHSYDCNLSGATPMQYLFLTLPASESRLDPCWSASPTNTIEYDLRPGMFGRHEPRMSMFGSRKGMSR